MHFKLREDHKLRVCGDGRVEVLGLRGKAFVALRPEQVALFQALVPGIDSRDAGSPAQGALLKVLWQSGLLINSARPGDRTEDWLAHFVGASAGVNRDWQQSRIVVLGCGGTGSVIADHLARVGLKHFLLIDGAKLDAPDLNRQLPYRLADVGRNKVDALAAHLAGNFDAIVAKQCANIDAAQQLVSMLEPFHGDMLFCCADTPVFDIQIFSITAAIAMAMPIVFGSVGVADYVVGPLLVKREDKRVMIDKLERRRIASPQPRIIGASICISNSLAAIEQAWLGIRYLMNPTEACLARMDNVTTSVDIASFVRTRSDESRG